MKKSLGILILLVLLSAKVLAAQSLSVYSEPDFTSEVVDKIPFNLKVKIIRESSDGEWKYVSYQDLNNHTRRGWVRKAIKREAKTWDDEPANRWSFGLGLGFFSSQGDSLLSISGDLRYLWFPYTESIVGLDLSLGPDSAIGYRIGQKFYAPISHKFIPFLYAGFRQFDVTDFKSSAYDPGIGFQYNSSSHSFFEVGLNYLMPKPFDSRKENIVYLNAATGFRF